MTKSATTCKTVSDGKLSKSAKSSGGVKVSAADQYSLVPVDSIVIVPKPQDENDDRLFYNPRGDDHFSPEKLLSLSYSIRLDGLMEPLVGRPVYTNTKNQKLDFVELIAGERRTRAIREIIVANDLPCFDEGAEKPKTFKSGAIVLHKSRFGKVVKQTSDIVSILFEANLGQPEETLDCGYKDVYPTASGKKLYQMVPIKLVPNCSDERAVRLNWVENGEGEPLDTKDEIFRIERLSKRFDQREIANLLGTNVTFVSQTACFRQQLPPEAFQYLMSGRMARHLAVKMLSYAKDDRQRYFDTMKAIEAEESAAEIEDHKRKQADLEDAADLTADSAVKAAASGDAEKAQRLARKAKSLEAKAAKEKARRERAESEQGTIKQGHAQRAAAAANVAPRRAKVLPPEQIKDKFVQEMLRYGTEKLIDPVTGQTVPCDYACIVRRTAMAILNGEYDPLVPIRDYMIDNGNWEEVAESAPSGKKGRRKNSSVSNDSEEDDGNTIDFDEDEDDDDDEFEDDDFDDFHDDGFDPVEALGYDPTEDDL